MTKAIRLGILLAGETGIDMLPHNPTYQDMFTEFFLPYRDQVEVSFIHTRHGDFPHQVTDYDAYLVSGSRHGVYDDLPWMPRLMDFIRLIYARHIPLIGICFGHQAIAHALGGEAVQSDKGWGTGVKEMIQQVSLPGGHDANQPVKMLYMHQDQVIRLPENAKPLLGDGFCPNAAFVIPGRVLTTQGHPEFTHSYLEALLDRRRDSIGFPQADIAKESLAEKTDNHLVRQWIMDFLDHSLATQSSAA